MKINLQKIRNISKRPACRWDDLPYVEELSDEEAQRSSGYGSVRPQGYGDPEENLTEGDVEVILIRRKASLQKAKKEKGPDLRYCEIVEVGSDDDLSVPDSPPLPKVSDGVLLDRINALRERYYSRPEQSRRYKRAMKNNKHIESKLADLRSHRKSFEVRMRFPRSGDTPEYLRRRVAELDAGIAKLESQYSDIDPVEEERKPGLRVPPPDGPLPGDQRKAKPRGPRDGSSTNLSERFLPKPRFRFSRLNGGIIHVCRGSEHLIPTLVCEDPGCPAIGTRYRSMDYIGEPGRPVVR